MLWRPSIGPTRRSGGEGAECFLDIFLRDLQRFESRIAIGITRCPSVRGWGRMFHVSTAVLSVFLDRPAPECHLNILL